MADKSVSTKSSLKQYFQALGQLRSSPQDPAQERAGFEKLLEAYDKLTPDEKDAVMRNHAIPPWNQGMRVLDRALQESKPGK